MCEHLGIESSRAVHWPQLDEFGELDLLLHKVVAGPSRRSYSERGVRILLAMKCIHNEIKNTDVKKKF